MTDRLHRLARLESAIFGSSAWSRSMLAGTLDHPGCLLVESDDGYALGTRVLEEVELLRIGVLPSWRRQGRGRVLLQTFLEACMEEGASRVLLEVRSDNAPARKLYESNGFRSLGTRRRYYTDGGDAVMYALDGLGEQADPQKPGPKR